MPTPPCSSESNIKLDVQSKRICGVCKFMQAFQLQEKVRQGNQIRRTCMSNTYPSLSLSLSLSDKFPCFPPCLHPSIRQNNNIFLLIH